jgi:hypothetical protein
MKSWTKIISASRNRLYQLCHHFSDGREAYYFVLIDPLKEQKFLNLLNQKLIKIAVIKIKKQSGK